MRFIYAKRRILHQLKCEGSIMTTVTNRLRQAAIAASAFFSVFAIGAANAAGIDAGTSVSNTFTLDYQVGGTPQTQIDNTGTPTTFTVDRLVDLTVTSQGDVNVSPGAMAQELVYGVRNDGNDNQAYSLALEDLAGDTFDATSLTAVFYTDAGADGIFTPGVDDAGAGTAYTPGSGAATTDVAPDATIWVVISGDIPVGATNGQTDGVILLADSLNPVVSLDPAYSAVAGTQTAAEAGANNQNGEAQNVLADGTGTATADANNDGAHSDTAHFNVVAAALTASKTVTVIATDSTTIACATDPAVPGNQYAVPGACIEYVISATNDVTASATATSIDIADVLPDEVAFVGSSQSGFTAAGTLANPPGGCTTSCSVALTGASLAPGVTGSVTIRATVR